ncbi:MAG: acetyl-CoA carboxylase carboxyltransferase subunit beta [Pelagibacteraceae bacterium]|jgi:acetyl-CoA carboxylase carboxyl transferase subunit beta|nr:acetyl-CoA carboxylase carboxyltransferase subunit beta [Pelagibacteraceae bacterium]MBT4950298.1 acetyl-CoA carboxylase carboxyltransferase subunit beta [Pelagibacteraceae bacterium]MBT6198147.1 acetyl-CoA carboxylase carboxyltransferase subunit beta [Pelagibacteraceae bacterium]MBT6354663.1 acetyl-CoA carboxylase carboxyltransferase subunit beta [Pelagibacteraceae bacterium]
MNWLTNFVKPKLSALVKRKDVPENLWQNCPSCGNMLHHKDLKENLRVCIACNHHFRMSAEDRINLLFSKNETTEIILDKISDDPLNFTDKKKYKDRLKEYRKKTQREDAFILLNTKIGNSNIVCGLMNFAFMGGSMGRAVGGAIVKGAKTALEKKCPFVIFTSSGGARMQEGIISLMQMPRTVAAVELLNTNKIPYIVVLTEPTTGGVTASFAMLGDITIAEQGSTIGFAGKRVIQDTIREELPIDFQKAEYLKEHGMVDIVCHRKDLKNNLEKVINHIT